MKLIDSADIKRSQQLEKIKSSDWPTYLHSFLVAYLLFAAVSHSFFPFLSPASLGLTIHSPAKIVFYYAFNYFLFFLSINVLLALPVIVVSKVIPKWRHIPLSFLLYRVLGPSWLIGLAMMYGGQLATNALS